MNILHMQNSFSSKWDREGKGPLKPWNYAKPNPDLLMPTQGHSISLFRRIHNIHPNTARLADALAGTYVSKWDGQDKVPLKQWNYTDPKPLTESQR